tara:strand:+ start:1428 stop:2183 length:756 start_codon:yes stop_codon:yes gene_type:complete
MKFTDRQIERYSRQIVLKKVGIIGQKKLLKSRVLIVGTGGLGSPIALYLAASGIGEIGVIDSDKVEISNIQRQILFNTKDIKKNKSLIAAKKLKQINPNIKVFFYKNRLKKENINKIAKNFDVIADGSDNFKTRFLINDYCVKNKKILVVGAISKFDGQIYTFNFSNKKSPCLRCFMPQMPNNTLNNCEYDGVLGPLAGIVGSVQANEIIKEILKIGDSLCGYILIINSLNLTFRKVKLKKRLKCYCNAKN